MRECEDVKMQEALPAFRAGGLDVAGAESVRAHLATCAACALELELLASARAVIDRATPAVDVTRLAAIVSAAVKTGAVTQRPPSQPRVIPLRTRRWWTSRQLLAAAASILVVVSLSLPALRGTGDGVASEVRRDSAGSFGGSSTAGEGASPSINLAGGLADLSSAQLETLLHELDQVEATIRAEPATVALPLLDAPESL